MRCIEKGRKQKGWAAELKCTGKGCSDGGCGATLLVERGDLFHTQHTDYGGGNDWYILFKCCECGVFTTVKESKAPCRPQELPTRTEWEKANP